jgi:DNA polymerase (family 10)
VSPVRAVRPAAKPAPSNLDVARLLRHVADLMERAGADVFRVRAWRRAAKSVEESDERVADLAAAGPEALRALPGIGPRLADVIVEIVRTGTLRNLADLRRRAPPPWRDLARIKGLGPKRAKRLAEALNVASVEELAAAARAGRVRQVRGFGAATEKAILADVERVAATPLRLHRGLAERAALPLLAALRETPGVERAELAGSMRRCVATNGDADFVCAARDASDVVERFAGFVEVASVVERDERRATVRLAGGFTAQLVVVDPRDFGAALWLATGSKAHVEEMRPRLAAKGLVLDEMGLRRDGRRVPTRDEDDVFRALGMPPIPPELREARGEIAAAAKGALPRLVEIGDVRGDLQVHSTDSDGRESIEDMAAAARRRGLSYMAFTDHTQTLRIANGMDEAGFRRQMTRIDALNETLDGFRVLKGAEVDILEDGSLDLDDETLAALDVVLVSIHSKFDLPPKKQTERVLRAISHPSVDVFAHPRGRRLGRRVGATFDLARVAEEAASRGVMLEADATPERQDLDGEGVRTALETGARIVVSTDAHAPREFEYLRYGVDQARRGWARARDVANTLDVDAFLALCHARR